MFDLNFKRELISQRNLELSKHIMLKSCTSSGETASKRVGVGAGDTN